MKSAILSLCFFLFLATPTFSMESPDTVFSDSVAFSLSPQARKGGSLSFRPQAMLVPATLLAVGTLGVTNGWVRKVNQSYAHAINPKGERHTKIDEYTRFLPLVGLYTATLMKVPAAHDWREQLLLTATSTLLCGGITWGMKHWAKHPRPDGSDIYSFPSGHTAFAFATAELLRQEFRHTVPWLSLAGYGIALGTAFLRTYNHRHWLTDVIAGVGIGIATARTAYWLLPWQRKLFGWDKKGRTAFLLPYASPHSMGVHYGLYL